MESIAKTDIGMFHLNRRSLAQLLRIDFNDDVWLNTTSLNDKLSILEEKLGEEVPLRFEISYRDMEVNFGLNDMDVSLEYTL